MIYGNWMRHLGGMGLSVIAMAGWLCPMMAAGADPQPAPAPQAAPTTQAKPLDGPDIPWRGGFGQVEPEAWHGELEKEVSTVVTKFMADIAANVQPSDNLPAQAQATMAKLVKAELVAWGASDAEIAAQPRFGSVGLNDEMAPLPQFDGHPISDWNVWDDPVGDVKWFAQALSRFPVANKQSAELALGIIKEDAAIWHYFGPMLKARQEAYLQSRVHLYAADAMTAILRQRDPKQGAAIGLDVEAKRFAALVASINGGMRANRVSGLGCCYRIKWWLRPNVLFNALAQIAPKGPQVPVLEALKTIDDLAVGLEDDLANDLKKQGAETAGRDIRPGSRLAILIAFYAQNINALEISFRRVRFMSSVDASEIKRLEKEVADFRLKAKAVSEVIRGYAATESQLAAQNGEMQADFDQKLVDKYNAMKQQEDALYADYKGKLQALCADLVKTNWIEPIKPGQVCLIQWSLHPRDGDEVRPVGPTVGVPTTVRVLYNDTPDDITHLSVDISVGGQPLHLTLHYNDVFSGESDPFMLDPAGEKRPVIDASSTRPAAP